MLWIIGEYAEIIEGSEDFLENFCENFKEEPFFVQSLLLTASVKLFLQRPEEGHVLVKKVLSLVTDESENPDLRDRGFIYWRLLNVDPEMARQVVLAERPQIHDMAFNMDSNLLDLLIENIGSLSSIYKKAPESFIKKLRDLKNLKFWFNFRETMEI